MSNRGAAISNMVKKIQIASDLHIDINSSRSFIKKEGDILCLVGDICSCGSLKGFNMLKVFLTRECADFEKVLYVAGNHEYYAQDFTSMETINARLKSLELEFPNFVLLDNSIAEISSGDRKLVFVGTTLWSFVPDHAKSVIRECINDYRMINREKILDDNKETKFVRHLSIEDTQQFHSDAIKFIEASVQRYASDASDNVDIVLLTHHKPVWDSNPKYNPNTHYAFQSDLSHLLLPPIKLAVHGHTHEPYDAIINDVRVVSNPHGYEDERDYFDNAFCVDL